MWTQFSRGCDSGPTKKMGKVEDSEANPEAFHTMSISSTLCVGTYVNSPIFPNFYPYRVLYTSHHPDIPWRLRKNNEESNFYVLLTKTTRGPLVIWAQQELSIWWRDTVCPAGNLQIFIIYASQVGSTVKILRLESWTIFFFVVFYICWDYAISND